MKILVCISSVPDTTSKISFKDSSTFNSDGIQYVINLSDEFGLTKALHLKEAFGGTITVINVGLADTEPVIRKALAIGADDAIRINASASNAFFVANEIAAIAKQNNYDIIFTGKESIDFNGGMVTGMLGELLNIPSFIPCVGLEIQGTDVTLECLVDGGKEVQTSKLPIVVGAQKGLVDEKDLRIPNMRGIMSARTKPFAVVQPTTSSNHESYKEFELPAAKAGCKMISKDDVQELVTLLHKEAKVI